MKWKFPPQHLVPYEYKWDVKRIRHVLVEAGYDDVSLIDCYNMWSDFSDSWAAGWLIVDNFSDEDIVRNLVDKEEEE